MIVINCDSCRKPLSLDETRLPMQEVTFPCPVCGGKLTVDRRNLPAPAVVAAPHDDEGVDLSPVGLVIGNSDPDVLAAVSSIGFRPHHLESPEAGRDFFLQEFPTLIVLRPPQVTIPPLAEMLPIVSMNPADRRKAFIILVADNLRTFDGNAAFLYGVNLVVNAKDLGSIRKIYREAEIHHRKLYQGMWALEKAG